MIDLSLLALAIGLGLVVTLLLSEGFGLSVGGLVVPGYLALFLTRPVFVVLTLAVAWATFALVRLVSSFLIVYGRRRVVLTILVGFLLGAALDLGIGGGVVLAAPGEAPPIGGGAPPVRFFELSAIGFIIPGLVALWIDRQGVAETFSGLLISSVVTRLLLVLLVPDDVQWHAAQHPSLLSRLDPSAPGG